MSLIFVDCEAWGGCPATGALPEFGAVEYKTEATFHGIIIETTPSAANPAIPEPTGISHNAVSVFRQFDEWLNQFRPGRPIFVSDNPAFDWQWINDGFLRYIGHNPFGHSARRIADFYAGLCGDFYKTQAWKRLRVTKHDHNPVHDSLGNLEAFKRMLAGER